MVLMGRRQARHVTAQRRRQSRGRKTPSLGWIIGKKVKFSTKPMKIHLQRPKAEYRSPFDKKYAFLWKQGASHYIPRINKSIECGFDECVVCAYRDPDAFGFDHIETPEWLEDCKPRFYNSFSVLVEEWHYMMELEFQGRDGKTRTQRKRLLEHEARKLVEKNGGNWRLERKELPRVFGRQGYADISNFVWEAEFGAVFEKVERMCKDGTYLFPISYGCGNCGTPHIELFEPCKNCDGTDISVDPEKHRAVCDDCGDGFSLLEAVNPELKELGKSAKYCEECEHEGYLVPKFVCLLDAESQDVQMEEPEDGWECYDIFDVQLTVRHEQQGEELPKTVIDDWEIAEPDPKLFDTKYQGEEVDQKAALTQVKYHRDPLNVEIMHPRLSPTEQARLLKLDNPFSEKSSPMAQTAKRYNKGKKPPVDSEYEEEVEDEDDGTDYDE